MRGAADHRGGELLRRVVGQGLPAAVLHIREAHCVLAGRHHGEHGLRWERPEGLAVNGLCRGHGWAPPVTEVTRRRPQPLGPRGANYQLVRSRLIQGVAFRRGRLDLLVMPALPASWRPRRPQSLWRCRDPRAAFLAGRRRLSSAAHPGACMRTLGPNLRIAEHLQKAHSDARNALCSVCLAGDSRGRPCPSRPRGAVVRTGGRPPPARASARCRGRWGRLCPAARRGRWGSRGLRGGRAGRADVRPRPGARIPRAGGGTGAAGSGGGPQASLRRRVGAQQGKGSAGGSAVAEPRLGDALAVVACGCVRMSGARSRYCSFQHCLAKLKNLQIAPPIAAQGLRDPLDRHRPHRRSPQHSGDDGEAHVSGRHLPRGHAVALQPGRRALQLRPPRAALGGRGCRLPGHGCDASHARRVHLGGQLPGSCIEGRRGRGGGKWARSPSPKTGPATASQRSDLGRRGFVRGDACSAVRVRAAAVLRTLLDEWATSLRMHDPDSPVCVCVCC